MVYIPISSIQDTEQLHISLAEIIPNLVGVETVAGLASVILSQPPSTEELTTIHQVVTAQVTKEHYEQVLADATTFGNRLVNEFATENILLGITQAGMTSRVRKNTAQVTAALSTGSLYDAMYEARQIPAEAKDPTFLTDTRLLAFINKIEAYLGLPLSTEL